MLSVPGTVIWNSYLTHWCSLLCHSRNGEPGCEMCKVRKAACQQEPTSTCLPRHDKLSVPTGIGTFYLCHCKVCQGNYGLWITIFISVIDYVCVCVCVCVVFQQISWCVLFRLNLFMSEAVQPQLVKLLCWVLLCCCFNHSASLRADMTGDLR